MTWSSGGEGFCVAFGFGPDIRISLFDGGEGVLDDTYDESVQSPRSEKLTPLLLPSRFPRPRQSATRPQGHSREQEFLEPV